MVDFDSPEALEEVFWRIFCGPAYIREDRLVGMRTSAETVERFRRYIALILKRYDCSRYLSKNNNNILRLGSLIEAFPSCRIVVPFRDPLQQAHSLLNQHRRFSEQGADKFTTRYMTWLAHHEFGADHRPFEWGMPAARPYAPATLNYWLAQWIGVYGYLLEEVPRHRQHAQFFSYELLCSETQREWQRLSDFLGFAAPAPVQLKASHVRIDEAVDEHLRAQAERLHFALLDPAIASSE